MENNQIVLARMTKDVFFLIPQEVRDLIMDFTVDRDDWNELKGDPVFMELYKIQKKAKDKFNKRKHELRHG